MGKPKYVVFLTRLKSSIKTITVAQQLMCLVVAKFHSMFTMLIALNLSSSSVKRMGFNRTLCCPKTSVSRTLQIIVIKFQERFIPRHVRWSHEDTAKPSTTFMLCQLKRKSAPYTKKACDFKIETSPKISKKFKYEQVCRPKSREICEHVETKTITPDCETSERLSCKYVQWAHQCKYDPKHYCHLVD